MENIDILELDPTKTVERTVNKFEKAGNVVDVNIGPGGWHALDGLYGCGGSDQYPSREKTEKRIKRSSEILRLRNPEVRIEPTNLCNYTCVMCPRDSHDRPKGYMPMTFYKSVVDEVHSMGAKQITLVNFGEPFIDPTLEDKIYYASQKGLRTYVISNASLFNRPSKSEFAKRSGKTMTKIEAAVAAGLCELRLSFYGADKETYEEIMVRGKFEQVEENIRHMSSARAQYGTNIVSPTTGDTIHSPEVSMYFLDFETKGDDGVESSEKMKQFLEYTKEFSDYVEVWRPHNFGAGRHYREVDAPIKKSCGRPFDGPVQINWKGIVVPCCYDYNEDIPLGNVALQTVEEVLRGEPLAKLQHAHKGNFEEVPYCNECDQLCPRNDAMVVSTNPKHQGRTKEDIMLSPNTSAGFKMGQQDI